MVNADNPKWGTSGGNATEDKLFLLSCDEVTNSAYGFDGISAAQRRNTAYVAAGGTLGSEYKYMASEGSTDWWWLRSPGIFSIYAMFVFNYGAVIRYGNYVIIINVAVCPALHLNLSSSNLWSYAGTVSSTDVPLQPECTEHQWDAGVVTKQATVTEDGEKTFTCTVCKETRTEIIKTTGVTEPGGHTPSVPSAPGGQQAASGDNQSTNVKVQAVRLSGTVKNLAAGKKTQLSAAVTPDNASDKSITWESSDTRYATVDSSGQVTAKAEGAGKTVTITAAAKDGSNIKAAYKIKIMKHAVKSIRLKAKSTSVKAGKSITIKPTIKTTGKNANKTLKWTSGNTKYATVSKKGKVKTKKAGKGKTVKITALSTDGSNKKATIKIKIK